MKSNLDSGYKSVFGVSVVDYLGKFGKKNVSSIIVSLGPFINAVPALTINYLLNNCTQNVTTIKTL